MESEEVAHDKHRELARRQDLKGGHQRQRDRFALLVASLRAERHVYSTPEEGVGIVLAAIFHLCRGVRVRPLSLTRVVTEIGASVSSEGWLAGEALVLGDLHLTRSEELDSFSSWCGLPVTINLLAGTPSAAHEAI